MRHLTTLATLSLLGALAACDRGEESSNLLSPSGAEPTAAGFASDALVQGSSLDSAQDVLAGVDLATPETGAFGAPSVQVPSAGRMAARASGESAVMVPGLSDTGAGYITFADTQTVAGALKADTVRIAWADGQPNPTVVHWFRGSKTWGKEGVRETYSLVPETGKDLSLGRAWLETKRSFATGLVHHARMLADPGADKNYGLEADNRIWSVAWARIKDGDTLGRAQVANADAALPLTGATKLVASAWEGAVAAHPLQKNRSWNLVARISGADTSIVALTAVRVGKYGRIDSVTTRNVNGSLETGIGDTAVIRHFVQYAGQTNSDSLLSREASMTVRLATGLGKEGNWLQGIAARRDHRLGSVARTEFSWKAVTEVLQGEEPVDGALTYKATLRDGRTGTLVGTFGKGVLEGTWTAPDGTVTAIRQTRN